MKLTKKQESVRRFIETELKAGRPCPTQREIAAHFGFSHASGAVRHLNALIKKGVLIAVHGKARALQIAGARAAEFVKIPFFGPISAGYGDDRSQAAEEFIQVDIATVGFKPSRYAFCVQCNGDSMIGKNICPGDYIICEPRNEPRNGDVVAALIDGQVTLKTFVKKGKRSFLKAENQKYPDLIPSEELVIQGVYQCLVRPRRG